MPVQVLREWSTYASNECNYRTNNLLSKNPVKHLVMTSPHLVQISIDKLSKVRLRLIVFRHRTHPRPSDGDVPESAPKCDREDVSLGYYQPPQPHQPITVFRTLDPCFLPAKLVPRLPRNLSVVVHSKYGQACINEWGIERMSIGKQTRE